MWQDQDAGQTLHGLERQRALALDHLAERTNPMARECERLRPPGKSRRAQWTKRTRRDPTARSKPTWQRRDPNEPSEAAPENSSPPAKRTQRCGRFERAQRVGIQTNPAARESKRTRQGGAK